MMLHAIADIEMKGGGRAEKGDLQQAVEEIETDSNAQGGHRNGY